MSTDFIGAVSQDLLNRASQSVFPAIGAKLGDTSRVDELKLQLAWAVAQPPEFILTSNDSGQTFLLNLIVALTITPDGGTATSEHVNVQATAAAAIDGSGRISLHVTDLHFQTSDAFVLAALNAKKADIWTQINSLIATFSIPLGPIGGIQFGGYGLSIDGGMACAAGGLSMPVSIGMRPPIGSGFGLLLSEPLMQTVIRDLWWNSAQKQFSSDGADVSLTGYQAQIGGGQIVLTLFLGGSYSKDLFLGTARWDINISPVQAILRLTMDENRNLRIVGGPVSHPTVSVTPANFLATTVSIFTMGIIDVVMNEIIAGQVQQQIQQNLSQTLMQIPILTYDFQGISFHVTPQNLVVGGGGNMILITGDASVTAG